MVGYSPSKGVEFHFAFTWKFSGPSSRAGPSARAAINFSQSSLKDQSLWVCLHRKFLGHLGEISLRRAGLLSLKRRQILQGFSQRVEIAAKSASLTRRAGSLPCKHLLREKKTFTCGLAWWCFNVTLLETWNRSESIQAVSRDKQTG